MKQAYHPLTLWLVGAAMGALLTLFFVLLADSARRSCRPLDAADSAIIARTDTVRVTSPALIPNKDTIVRYVRIPVAARDTHGAERITSTPDTISTAQPDTLTFPITQRTYHDSTYTAWVSGYLPALDSIQIRHNTHYIYKERATPPRRWSFGVQGGVGLTPKGVQPYIGVGVQFRLY